MGPPEIQDPAAERGIFFTSAAENSRPLSLAPTTASQLLPANVFVAASRGIIMPHFTIAIGI